MLHMIINTHEPDSCAFRSDENKAVMMGGFSELDAIARAHDAEVQGIWANLASHHVFVLVDAPHAHIVDDIVREAGLIGHTTTQVFAVHSMEDALERVE